MEYIKPNIMKAIYLLLILVLFTSCEYSIKNVNDPDTITSVEMAQEIEKDTTEYKVLKKDSTIYLVDIIIIIVVVTTVGALIGLLSMLSGSNRAP